MKTIRTETDRNELIKRIEKLQGTETAKWGKMNVNQMLSHLVQAGSLPFENITPDRSSFFSRSLLKPLVLYVLPMPKEVKTAPQIDQMQDGRKPGEFESDRADVIASINKIASLPEDTKCLDHPFFGPMSAKDWALIAHKHTDHHLKQFGV